jgi:hypothetical protein
MLDTPSMPKPDNSAAAETACEQALLDRSRACNHFFSWYIPRLGELNFFFSLIRV